MADSGWNLCRFEGVDLLAEISSVFLDARARKKERERERENVVEARFEATTRAKSVLAAFSKSTERRHRPGISARERAIYSLLDSGEDAE